MTSIELKQTKLSPTSKLIVEIATDRGYNFSKMENGKYCLFNDMKSYTFKRFICSSYNSKLAKRCTDQKEVTSRLLRSKGYYSPENAVFNKGDLERAWKWAEPILPVVVKPSNSTIGRSVFVNICDYNEFKYCYNKVSEKYDSILIEKFESGEEFRFTFIKNRIVAVANRKPASIKGDGESTIEHLIAEKNSERERRKNRIHKKLKIDDEAMRLLDKVGFTLKSIPQKDEIVYLKKNSNVSTGGDAFDVTDEISQDIKDYVAKAMKMIDGLMVAGVDVILNGDKVTILEINADPMLSMHHFPWEGQPRDVVGILLDEMFEK